jgi:uncharacterized protein YndB with AHSA1/START domain
LTEGLGDWLGDPTSWWSEAVVGVPLYLEIDLGTSSGAATYGRFVELRPDRLVAMTWISEALDGVEFRVEIELTPTDAGTDVSIEHSPVPGSTARRRLTDMWLRAFRSLDDVIASTGD